MDCVELSEQRAAVIESAGYARRVKVADFLAIDPEPVYDRVLMNPPFAAKADIHHVTHALKFLRPGGLLVAIMGAGTEFRQDGLTASFRDSVGEAGGTVTALPEQAFRESGTDAHTVLVTIPAPAAVSTARLVVDGKALRLERDGRTLGRIRATAGKLATGEGRFIFWASTPAGAMTHSLAGRGGSTSHQAVSLTSQGGGHRTTVHGARPWNGQGASQRDWSSGT